MGSHLIGVIFGSAVGFGVTAFFILPPLLRKGMDKAVYLTIWFVVLTLDLGTSVIGAIWYGAMESDPRSTIVLSELTITSSNAYAAFGWSFGALFLTAACLVLGYSVERHQQRQAAEEEEEEDFTGMVKKILSIETNERPS